MYPEVRTGVFHITMDQCVYVVKAPYTTDDLCGDCPVVLGNPRRRVFVTAGFYCRLMERARSLKGYYVLQADIN